MASRTEHVLDLSVAEIVAGVRERKFSAAEIALSVLERMKTRDEEVGALLHTEVAKLKTQARKIDAKVYAREELGPLAGVPVGIKDLLITQGIPTTCGSRILEGYVPPYNATVVRRLQAAGALVAAKTNCDEFGMGSSNENSAYQPCRNPWDPARVPGGSSGGSAAAVAAGMFPIALGTDTGGSIRQPAALCGVSGLKPSYGRVSRHGLVAFASSLDVAGPLGRSVEDLAFVLESIAGYDPKDSTSVPRSVPGYVAAVRHARQDGVLKSWRISSGEKRPLRIGVPEEYFGEACEPPVTAAVKAAIEALAKNGAEVLDVSLPHTDYALAAYYIIAPAEASSNLARYDGVRYGVRKSAGGLRETYEATRREGFGAEVRRRIMLGTYALSAGYYDEFYLRAQKVRTLIRRDFDEVFANVDLLLAPTSPLTAFPLGERVDDPLHMYMADVLTIAGSLAGITAMNVPCGFDGEGLPIGLQIMGPQFGEVDVLRCGARYQALTDWHTRRPGDRVETSEEGGERG